MQCCLICCMLVIDSAWADFDLVWFDSSLSQLIQFGLILSWSDFDSMWVWSVWSWSVLIVFLLLIGVIRFYSVWFALIRVNALLFDLCFVCVCVGFNLVWASFNFAWLDSSVLQLIQFDPILCCFGSIWFAVIWFDLHWVSSFRSDFVLPRWFVLVWFGCDPMLFDSGLFHVVPFASTCIDLIVLCLNWFYSFWSDVFWFDLFRATLRSFGFMLFGLLWVGLVWRANQTT